jgi:type I restriction enzyme S subunit
MVLSENCKLGIINPRLVKISLFKEIDRSYFKVIFASPLLRNEMIDRSHGGTMNILNLGLLRELALPFPPLSEQHRIVVKVDELMTLCDQLKARVTEASQLQQKLADVLVEQAVA